MQECNFNELYVKLEQYCLYLSRNKWEREDLIQDTFLKAMNKYQDKEITLALLKRIARNQQIDGIRKKREMPSDHINEKGSEQKLLQTMIVAEILADHLTFKQGLVYALVEGFQYRLKEVASTLMISETAAKSILFRARNQLNKELSYSQSRPEEERKEIYHIYYQALKDENPIVLIKSFYNYARFSTRKKPAIEHNAMLIAA